MNQTGIKKEKLVFVAHPDDESIFAAEILDQYTHVILVTDANYDGIGKKRKVLFSKVMNFTNSSYEMWDFPENYYKSTVGWSKDIQNKIIKRIEEIMKKFNKDINHIYTHNELGEYGHIDHQNLNSAVLSAYKTVFLYKEQCKQFYFFVIHRYLQRSSYLF